MIAVSVLFGSALPVSWKHPHPAIWVSVVMPRSSKSRISVAAEITSVPIPSPGSRQMVVICFGTREITFYVSDFVL